MRPLTRRELAEVHALEHAIEREPMLRPVLVEDYGMTRAQLHDMRALLGRRIAASSRHPDEPGSMAASDARPWGVESRSNLKPGDGVARYGDPDHTGFCDGAVF